MPGAITRKEFIPALGRVRDPGVGDADHESWRFTGAVDELLARLRAELGTPWAVLASPSYRVRGRSPRRPTMWVAYRPEMAQGVVFWLIPDDVGAYRIELHPECP